MTKLMFVVLTVGLLTSQGIAAQSKRVSIQGVWRIVEITSTGPGARTRAMSERSNLTIITAKHYSRIEDQSATPRPIPADVAKASADELRAVWGPFRGEAGTYELTGENLITMHPSLSKNPVVSGTFTVYSYKLDGDTLWLIQQRDQNGPFANPFTIKATRVE